MRALIADDDSANREILTRMLAHLGWESDAVNDGAAAAERALKGGYDAVLLDICMPGVDGFEAARRIREGGSRVPLLAVSGAEEDQRALDSGFDLCLPKPYTLENLRDALRGLAGK